MHPLARAVVVVVALLSIFWFPWSWSLAFMFAGGLVFPPVAVALGILSDLLYYPGHGLPWGSILGVLLALVAHAVRHFVKTRIM